MILDHLILIIMILDTICTFLIHDIRKIQKKAQPIEVEMKFSENIPAGRYGSALGLTNKLTRISSDGQRHFDLS